MINWGSRFNYLCNNEKPPKLGEVLPVICPICGADTDAEVKCTFISEQNNYIKLPTSNMEVHNYLLRCTRCSSGILLLWSYGVITNTGVSAGKLVYPYYNNAFQIKELNKETIPEAIFVDIKQAESSYSIGAYLGSGLLLRRACQNICRDKDAEGSKLYDEINSLCDKGLITKDMKEMAHNIRIIGNELSHPKPGTAFLIERDDIIECSEFIKQLIQVLYINPYKAMKLRESIKERGIEK